MGTPLLRDSQGSRDWYADRLCQVIAHGGPRHTPERTGWGDYLARWTYLRTRGMESDDQADAFNDAL